MKNNKIDVLNFDQNSEQHSCDTFILNFIFFFHSVKELSRICKYSNHCIISYRIEYDINLSFKIKFMKQAFQKFHKFLYEMTMSARFLTLKNEFYHLRRGHYFKRKGMMCSQHYMFP